MKRFLRRKCLRFALAGVAVLAIFLGIFAAPATVASTSPYADEVVRLVNVERARAGLPPLVIDETLNEAARTRAQEESAYAQLEHKRPDAALHH